MQISISSDTSDQTIHSQQIPIEESERVTGEGRLQVTGTADCYSLYILVFQLLKACALN